MKKLLTTFTLAALSLSCVSPLSADVCCPPVCQSYCEPFFDGFHVGGNVGFISHHAHRADLDGFFNGGTPVQDISWTAGVQLGYDWSLCRNLVLGFVADWNRSGAEGKNQVADIFLTDEVFIKSELRWFATIRARAGFPVCNAFLLYVTGGAAVADFKTRLDVVVDQFSHDKKRWGWTGGLGAEWAVACHWSVNAEVLYMHFEEHRKNFTGSVIVTSTHTFNFNDEAWVGRIGFNYRFSL